jgi:hypothetical protein
MGPAKQGDDRVDLLRLKLRLEKVVAADGIYID